MPLESNNNMKKISVIIAGGHQTSISLEEPFWKEFQLIAKINNQSINQLVTKSNLEGFYSKPRIDLNCIKDSGKDLVICTAGLASKIAKESDYEKCIYYINEYKKYFPAI